MGLTIAAGMRVRCRDAEWLVQRVEASNSAGTQYAVQVVGVDDLVRGHQANFLTQFRGSAAADASGRRGARSRWARCF